MAEWSIAAVLKTVKPKGFGGSNPSVSARWSNPHTETLQGEMPEWSIGAVSKTVERIAFQGFESLSLREKPQLLLRLFAERKGFEPLERNAFNGFRDRPDRPLRHLSLLPCLAGSFNMKATCVATGGDRGIRTPEAFRLNGFQDRRYRPLSHISAAKVQQFSFG